MPSKLPMPQEPLTPTLEPKRLGRPPKPKLPPKPNFQMDAFEREWYEYHIGSFLYEYPDMTATDHIHLMLASVEFIKWLRMQKTELSTKELVSQARQHPGTVYLRLMDSLSFNRKARMAAQPKKTEDDTPDWLKLLSSDSAA